ncbi:MAG: serine hydrolase domain-containing protein [Pseudohongiella sp.]|nr:serine hydrolase domain-containing protein [Pseudohongiella sp.]MDP2285948.1 serine hydrolase domain-containing protein [Pseudohongiella sp.]
MKPIVPHGETEEFFQWASLELESKNAGNAALLVIAEGEVVAEYYSSSHDSIDGSTVFLTASMSKWFAANGVMKLVQDGLIDLDMPVSSYLTRWEFPSSEFDNNQVTTRRLLSHTAGLVDGLGFGDYSADEEIPALEDSLSNPRASNNRDVEIVVGIEPGSVWRYSGGGYLILQLLIEEVTGTTFREYMAKTFFEPLGMTRSTYIYMGDIENNAGSYDRNGQAAPIYKYASDAATGFITSSSDLARFVLAQIPGQGNDAILDQSTLETMRQPHGRTLGVDIWGLGTILYSPTEGGDFVFGHDGANDPAINSAVRINPESKDAIVILATGGPPIATNIGSQWVLWQTGYPDVLNSESIIKSMYLPMLVGLLILLLTSIYMGHRYQRRSQQGSRMKKVETRGT